MNSYTDNRITITAGEALAKYRRVKKSGATVVYADAGEDSIGVTMFNVASGDPAVVKLWNDGGTFPIEAAGAITANAAVYGANDGKIDDTVSGEKLGTANEAATASGQVIEVISATPANITAVQSLISDPAACASMTQNTLTDSGAGTADQTVEDVADIALSTSDTYTDAAVNGAVNTAIASISNNFKEMTTELALIKADTAALKTAIDANNAAIDSIIDALQANGIVATS